MKILKKDGWFEIETNGSHVQMKHPTKEGKVTVVKHSGDLPKGTLNSILKQAGLK
jgi:predicted RNA binding protein YcfA (HicA-like mRNA interferase family)